MEFILDEAYYSDLSTLLAALLWTIIILSAIAIIILAFMVITSIVILAIPVIQYLRDKSLTMNHSDSGIINIDFES